MDEKEHNRPNRKMIPGGGESRLAIGAVQIFVGPEKMSPYPVDAMVAEEDTFLVLSADPELFESNESPIRVLTEAFETRPETPGSVLVKDGHPLQFLAIIHDLDQEPSWKEEWVVSALDGILRETENRKLRSIALPLLGTLHGSLGKGRFITLLRESLERKAPRYLKRLWLVTPEGTATEILRILRAELPK
jgi:hypothetical protein